MIARVVFTDDFRADLAAQTRWLMDQGRADWARRLIDEIAALAAVLERTPEIGAVELRREGREIRRLLLRRLPFVAWYHWSGHKVAVLRLFHIRQRRNRR